MQYDYLHNYNRLSEFLKQRGILPRYDIETFNKDVVIGNEAPFKNSTINMQIKKLFIQKLLENEANRNLKQFARQMFMIRNHQRIGIKVKELMKM